MATKKVDERERLTEYRILLMPTMVNTYRQMALDRTRRTGVYMSWARVVREVLTAAAASKGVAN